jgi:hypothetical protein
MRNTRKTQTHRERARILLVPALLLLAACSPAESGIIVGASLISLLETDKTVPDHIMSQMLNKDCSSQRLLEGADKMCLDENGPTTVAQSIPSYCYRTLGNITCYTEPNPFDPKSNQVAWPRPWQPEPAASVALRDGENKGN